MQIIFIHLLSSALSAWGVLGVLGGKLIYVLTRHHHRGNR
jgi:hypothetical protein